MTIGAMGAERNAAGASWSELGALERLSRCAALSRKVEAELLAALAVVDERRLWADFAYPSLFEYVRMWLGGGGEVDHRRKRGGLGGEDRRKNQSPARGDGLGASSGRGGGKARAPQHPAPPATGTADPAPLHRPQRQHRPQRPPLRLPRYSRRRCTGFTPRSQRRAKRNSSGRKRSWRGRWPLAMCPRSWSSRWTCSSKMRRGGASAQAGLLAERLSPGAPSPRGARGASQRQCAGRSSSGMGAGAPTWTRAANAAAVRWAWSCTT
jgi:hypothetical protein